MQNNQEQKLATPEQIAMMQLKEEQAKSGKRWLNAKKESKESMEKSSELQFLIEEINSL